MTLSGLKGPRFGESKGQFEEAGRYYWWFVYTTIFLSRFHLKDEGLCIFELFSCWPRKFAG